MDYIKMLYYVNFDFFYNDIFLFKIRLKSSQKIQQVTKVIKRKRFIT